MKNPPIEGPSQNLPKIARYRRALARTTPAFDRRKAEARCRRAQGATLAELARSYDVSKTTISRLTKGCMK